MSSFLENEAKGDWRNFKGDHYHLIYLIWSLLHENGTIAFYQGNDLLRQVSSLAPPAEGEIILCLSQSSENEHDEWIQLKSAEKANWTCRPIIQDLLENFLFNALLSESRGRQWSVSLVTQSTIDKANIENFLANYGKSQSQPELASEFENAINEVVRRWNSENQNNVSFADAEYLALKIMRQLSEQHPRPLNELKLECQNVLLETYPNKQRVTGILDTLSGALLEEARKGPQHARSYDLAWLEQAAGESLKPTGLFDRDPKAGCEQANKANLPRNWNPQNLTTRTKLEEALREFLVAPESVFCLIGLSGVGKSWTAAWVATQCVEHQCLLVPASQILLFKTVPELVASRIKTYTHIESSPEALLRRWKAATGVGKTPVLILDDILIAGANARQLRQHLASLCEEARQHGIKLVFTCQAQIWRINKLGDAINPADVFALNSEQDDPISLPQVDETPEIEPANEAYKEAFEAEVNAAKGEWRQHSLKTQRVSYVLENFNADELEDAVKRRLENVAPARRSHVAYQLRSPAFGALRNPYLLSQYIRQNNEALRGSTTPPPLDIDKLLDERVQSGLREVADGMNCDVTDLQSAFAFLVAAMWDARSQGLSKDDLVRQLSAQFGLDGNEFVAQLRLAALLTPTSPLFLERTPVAERLFALELEKRVTNGSSLLGQLRLEEDNGIVATFLRHLSGQPRAINDAPSATSPYIELDAVAVAEQLLHADRRWLRAVCDGLSQASPDDVRVVSLLMTLTNPATHEGLVEAQACRALGRLAARGGEARRWVAAAYLSDSFAEHVRGARALSEILEFDPRRVGKIVARRLMRAAQIDCFEFGKRKRRDKLLRSALDPLNHPQHREAARVAKTVAASYADLVTHCGPRDYVDEHGNAVRRAMFDHDFDWSLAGDLAEVRGGQIAWDDAECDVALRDLSSDDRQTRLFAALAMRPASFSALDQIADVLLERLRVETDPVILSRLLWASNGLARPRYAARLLAAMREGATNRWDDRLVCGPALIMLARLAPRDPSGVFEMLPRRLDKLSAVEAMYEHEALVYAWWALADQSKQLPPIIREFPWQHLQELSVSPEPALISSEETESALGETEQERIDQSGSEQIEGDQEFQSQLKPRDGWVFWAKGAALARLALLGRDRIRAAESQMNEMGTWWPYYFAELDVLSEKYTTFIAAQIGFSGFQEALIAAVKAHSEALVMADHSSDMEQQTFKDRGFSATAECLECLSAILVGSTSLMQVVEQVPRRALADWQQIHLVRRLLERGCRDAQLIELAETICKELRTHYAANGAAEREKTLAVLAQIRAESEGFVPKQEPAEVSFWGNGERAEKLAKLTDFRPERLLQILDESVVLVDDLLTLYLWQRETRDWRALLISKVFARMFDARPIRRTEALRLCNWMLTALQALPESELREQWWTTYSVIHEFLTSSVSPGGTIEGRRSPLQDNNLQTMITLNEAVKQGTLSREWLSDYFAPTSTLLLASTFSVKDGELSYSMGHGSKTLYCFPAIRLLGVALDKQRFDIDPVARRMQNRAQLNEFLDKYWFFFQNSASQSREAKNQIATEFEALLESRKIANAPHDDEFPLLYVNILLLTDHPQKAEGFAEIYLEEIGDKPLVTNSTLNALWYDLSCAKARLGKESEAHSALLKASEYAPLNGEHMSEDSDLTSLRECGWFVSLVEQNTLPKADRTVHYRLTPPAVVSDVKIEGNKYSISLEMDGRQVGVERD